MVNFHDLTIDARDYLTVVKFLHAVDSVYIWEFFTTLNYEWSIIRGRRPYRWTIWIYSLVRLGTLLAAIVNMVGLNVTRPINCQAWITFEITFAYIGIAASSLLIALRTIAIWKRKRIVIIMVMGTWLTNVSFFIEGIVRFRATWEIPPAAPGSCTVLNAEVGKPAILSTLASDMIMLLTMLIGLLRMRLEGGSFGLARLLWTQGIIWLFLATVAEVPASVFICLNPNHPYNIMSQIPALVVISIASTRMYRSLTDFGSSDISPQDVFQSGRCVSMTRQIPVPVPAFSPNPVEVGVHTISERYPAPRTSHDGLYITTDGQLYDKSRGLCLVDEGESGGER